MYICIENKYAKLTTLPMFFTFMQHALFHLFIIGLHDSILTITHKVKRTLGGC